MACIFSSSAWLHGVHFLFFRLAVEEGGQLRQAIGIEIGGNVHIL